MLDEILDEDFFNSFCKVEFLCYQGDPNWLGWIFVIFFVTFFGRMPKNITFFGPVLFSNVGSFANVSPISQQILL